MAEDVSSAAEVFTFDIHRQKYGEYQGSNDCHPYTTHLAVFATSSHFFFHSHLLAFFPCKKGDSIQLVFFFLAAADMSPL